MTERRSQALDDGRGVRTGAHCAGQVCTGGAGLADRPHSTAHVGLRSPAGDLMAGRYAGLPLDAMSS